MYIGPNQYFVITDIGGGRYQWYAFLARDEGSEASEPKPDGASPYLQKLFTGWSPEVIDILQATREDEIEQRDLYDRWPEFFRSWADDSTVLVGDAVHPMMPNLGQGGCQASRARTPPTQRASGPIPHTLTPCTRRRHS